MLDRKAIVETIAAACADGALVLRLARPDRTYRTYWHQQIEPSVLDESALEAMLPEAAELTSIVPALLAPNALPGLWHGTSLQVGALASYFAGGTVIQIDRGSYQDPRAIPTAVPQVLEEAVRAAVLAGHLWISTGTAGFLKEEIPAGLLTDSALLAAPPAPINVMDLLPANLPAARGLPIPNGHNFGEGAQPAESTTAQAILDALSQKAAARCRGRLFAPPSPGHSRPTC